MPINNGTHITFVRVFLMRSVSFRHATGWEAALVLARCRRAIVSQRLWAVSSALSSWLSTLTPSDSAEFLTTTSGRNVSCQNVPRVFGATVLPRSSWKNLQPLRSGKCALANVKRIEDVRLENKCGGNVEKIECSGAQLRAMLTRKSHSLFPYVGAKRCHAKHTGGLMLQEQFADRPSLAARPFLSEHSQFDGVSEFRLAQRGQQKHGLGPNQGSGHS